IAWLAGCALLALVLGFVVDISLLLLRSNPGWLKERMTVSRPDQEPWDLVAFLLVILCFIAWLILMPLDAVRFHWSALPAWLRVAGAIVLVGSLWLFFVALRENSFLSPMVRIQRERGQRVVSTRPYRYVRRPYSAGFLVFVVGTALLLGSWYGLLFGLMLVGLVARRAVLEERLLRRELEGYDAYMAQVRHRLIPHVW